MTVQISNIQHFSVGDGPGIRTTLFFKGCNLRCPWCHNPENLSFAPVTLRYQGREEEVCGRTASIQEILPELLEDRDFFEQSGGGVTFSGGEVLLQAEQVSHLASALKEQGIAVLIDTAGSVPYRAFELLNPLVEGYLFDFKTANAERYRQIGGDMELITQNLNRLLEANISVRVRIPLIPDFNTDPQSIAELCAHLKGLGVEKVDLLPFHRLGSAKYEALGLHYSYKDYAPFSPKQLEKISQQYSKHFQVTMER